MDKAAVQRLVGRSGHGLGPDPPLGKLEVRRPIVYPPRRRIGSGQQRIRLVPIDFNNMLPSHPEEVGMMHEGGELADLLSNALLWPELPHQRDHVAIQQKRVAIRRIHTIRRESVADRGEALIGEVGEGEVERGGSGTSGHAGKVVTRR
jgi:hypothetical protein